MASYPAEKDAMKVHTDSDTDQKPEYGDSKPTVNNDAVFGEITEDGPNYRNVRQHLKSGRNELSNSH